MINNYNNNALKEMTDWQKKIQQRPSLLNNLSKKIQIKINSWIPEKVHKAITTAIKQMIRGVLFGATYTTAIPKSNYTLQQSEEAIFKKINASRKTAAVEGGITGAGGIILGLADFPILIAIKIKLLIDIAGLYGFDVTEYKERLFLLHIFELAFSSPSHRKIVFDKMKNWQEIAGQLPDDINQFDWRNFQQEYRDYLDLAKMAQLIPVIGAPVGVIVNNSLIKKLGNTAMNAYRMRIFQAKLLLEQQALPA